ncbi:MAG: hypothetical protein ABI678_04935 [Kofleriaceae bacterium]
MKALAEDGSASEFHGFIRARLAAVTTLSTLEQVSADLLCDVLCADEGACFLHDSRSGELWSSRPNVELSPRYADLARLVSTQCKLTVRRHSGRTWIGVPVLRNGSNTADAVLLVEKAFGSQPDDRELALASQFAAIVGERIADVETSEIADEEAPLFLPEAIASYQGGTWGEHMRVPSRWPHRAMVGMTVALVAGLVALRARTLPAYAEGSVSCVSNFLVGAVPCVSACRVPSEARLKIVGPGESRELQIAGSSLSVDRTGGRVLTITTRARCEPARARYDELHAFLPVGEARAASVVLESWARP